MKNILIEKFIIINEIPEGTFGINRPRRDDVKAHPVSPPFSSKRFVQNFNTSLEYFA